MDYRAKTVRFAVPEHPLKDCRGTFPTADGDIVVEWERGSEPRLTLPKGWRSLE